MQLRAVGCLRLIGDTEGPALITGATWLRVIPTRRLLGTPSTMLTQGVRSTKEYFSFKSSPSELILSLGKKREQFLK